MSEESTAGSGTELSNEPISTEIGTGVEQEAAVEAAEAEQSAEPSSQPEMSDAQAEDLADQIEQAVEDGASEEEIQDLVETFKLKVYGEEKEVTVDWNDKDDIRRRLQLAEASHINMQRAAELEKSFESKIYGALEDPWAFLEELGLNPDELAEQRITQQIEQLKKTPDQIAQEQKDRELEELRQQIRQQEKEREEYEMQILQREAEEKLENEIVDALSSTTELPKSPYIVKRVADAMLTAYKSGREDISASDVIPWVEKEINEEFQTLFSELPAKTVEKLLGKKTVDNLRKERLAKMNTPSLKEIKDSGNTKPVEPKKKSKISVNQWLRHGASLKDFE